MGDRSDRLNEPYEEQPAFDYFECKECGFDSIQMADFTGSEDCPLCRGDCNHDVRMSRRTARTTDTPEGIDMRLGARELQEAQRLKRLEGGE